MRAYWFKLKLLERRVIEMSGEMKVPSHKKRTRRTLLVCFAELSLRVI